MRSTIIILFLVVLTNIANAQSVDGIDLSDKAFIQVIAWQKSVGGFGNYKIYIDYGQDDPLKNRVIKDKEGKVISSTSFISTLNFLNKNDWELVDVQTWQTDTYFRQFAILKNKNLK